MSHRDQVARLRAAAPAIVPSLLMCDFAHLEREVRRLEDAGAQALHLDVMDGHFVPNLSYGLPLVETFRRLTSLPLDAHLMIDNPADFLARYIDAGADTVTFHREVVDDPVPLLELARERGAGAGLALNPRTTLADAEHWLPSCDLVLVMSVEPGFGGQKFESGVLAKVTQLAKRASPPLVEVDGGINDATIALCADAGADLFVVGTAIFKYPDYGARIRALAELAQHKSERFADK